MRNLILLVFVLVLPLISSASANEFQDRLAMYAEVKKLLLEEKFSELDLMAKQYREKEEKMSSGVWKLTFFYFSFKGAYPIEQMYLNSWYEFADKADLWISKSPNSPAPYIAKSLILLRQAWIIRGGGYAFRVEPKAWKSFYEKVALAKKTLEDSKKVSSVDPHWYVVMADIAKLESWDEAALKDLFEQGVKQSPYYYQLYFVVAMYYESRWHGNAQKLESFARNALEKTKDKEGYSLYTRIYWSASQSYFSGELFKKSNVDWKIMSKGIDDILKKYPDQWNINNFAHFSCLAKDKEKTKELVALITPRPIEIAWKEEYVSGGKKFRSCKKWATSAR